MQFTIELSRDERWTLLNSINEKQFQLNSEIADISPIKEQWAQDEVAKMEDRIRQLKILAIKIEG
jgi:uncharacterized protein YlxW (UPF0749 family)